MSIKKDELLPWWKTSFFIAFLSSLFLTFEKVVDSAVVNNFFYSKDGIASISAYLLVGCWIGSLIGIVMAVITKRKIEPDIKSFEWRDKKMHFTTLVSGALAAVATGVFLYANQKADVSVIISLGNGVIIYMMLLEVAQKRIELKKILVPGLLVFVGGILSSINPKSLSASVEVVVLMFGAYSFCLAVGEVVVRDTCKRVGGVTVSVWRFVYLTITASLIVLVSSNWRGTNSELLGVIGEASKSGVVIWIAIAMVLVFFGNAFNQIAKKSGSVSEIGVVRASHIVLGYVVAIVGNLLVPGVFGNMPSDIYVWGIRIAGAVLICMGVILVYKNNKKITKNS